MNYVMVNTNASLMLDDPTVQAKASSFEGLYAQMVVDMQARFTDGRTYGDYLEDIYKGREEWVAFYAARCRMMHWLAAQNALEFHNEPVLGIVQ